MGRQKLGNKNAQANNNAKHNYNQEFSSEFKANQAQKAKRAKSANDTYAGEFASELNLGVRWASRIVEFGLVFVLHGCITALERATIEGESPVSQLCSIKLPLLESGCLRVQP
jgi:hypothetical protein